MESKFGRFTLEDVVDPILDQWEEMESIIEEIVDPICRGLDNYITSISKRIYRDTEISTEDLEEIILKIPIQLYWIGQGLESVGTKEDISKLIKSGKYREVFRESQGKISDREALAEDSTYADTYINIIYNRAYKKIKGRIDVAMEVMQSAKKILNRRIAEFELSGGKQ